MVSTEEHTTPRGLRRGLLLCGLAAVLFGATVPVASRLVQRTSAPMLAGLLYLGAAGAVLPLVARGGRVVATLRRGGRGLAVAVVAGGCLGPLLLTAGLSRTPAATVSLLLNAELVATALVAAVVLHEQVGRRVAVGIVFVTAAGATLVWDGTSALRTGALLVLGACTCWGVDNAVTAQLDELSPEHITLAKGVIAGTTNMVIAFVAGSAMPSGWVVLAALATGAIGYGASITLWVSGARELGAARGQLVFSIAPFVGAVGAWVVLGERVAPAQVIALGLAVAGVAFVVGSDHEHQHVHAALEHVHLHDHDSHHRHAHADEVDGPHTHPHRHQPLAHAHPHVPDLHHKHEHD